MTASEESLAATNDPEPQEGLVGRESPGAGQVTGSAAPADPASTAEPTFPGEATPSPQAELGTGEAPRPRDQVPGSRRPRTTRTLTRVSLGGAALGLDTLKEVLDEVEAAEAEPESRTLDQVLVPVTEWEERFGESPDVAARYLMIGMMSDARSRAGRALRFVDRLSNTVGKSIKAVFAPLYRSRPAGPVRHRFETAMGRGQSQVDHWMTLGRAEDRRNRALAQIAVNQVANDSMDELVDNRRIQVFIQEVVQAQSQGFAAETIQEVRERTVSSDDFIERPVRRLLRRQPRGAVPAPDFDPALAWRSRRPLPVNVDQTRLGDYAGFASRALAFAIDIAILAALLGMTTWLITNTVDLLGLGNYFEAMLTADNLLGIVGSLATAFYGIIVVVAYFLVLWLLTGQTIGMMALGLRVVARDGGRVTVWKGLLRWIGYLISAAFLFLGFLWIVVDSKRQGWHDKLAGTYVVYSWEARPDETFLIEMETQGSTQPSVSNSRSA